jgi:hypothetical protein
MNRLWQLLINQKTKMALKIYNYIAGTPDGRFAATWGYSRSHALERIRVQDPSARLIGPALRWRWYARLMCCYLRKHPDHADVVEARLSTYLSA